MSNDKPPPDSVPPPIDAGAEPRIPTSAEPKVGTHVASLAVDNNAVAITVPFTSSEPAWIRRRLVCRFPLLVRG